MAAYKADHEDRPARRQAMLEMRKKGMSYAAIGRKFKIASNSARAVLLNLYKKLGIADPKKSEAK